MIYKVENNTKLNGTIKINGSKNASLAIVVGAILAKDIVILNNVPNITDIHDLLDILRYLNCKVDYNDHILKIDGRNVVYKDLRIDKIKKLRASYYFVGAFLALFEKVNIYKPGGCNFQNRPIDIHLNGFEKMGAKIIETDNEVCISCDNHLKARQINLSFPSVGATINLILASVLLEDTTVLRNVATEPEIVDFIMFLKKMGANIDGEGTKTIIIHKNNRLHGCTYTIMPDRIECGTYLIYGAALAKKLTITNIISRQVRSLLSIFIEMGIHMEIKENEITIYETNNLKPVKIVTGPYPSFPTDLQQVICPLLLKADGQSMIIDTIYSKRISHIEELKKLNANVKIVDNFMLIDKSDKLIANTIKCNDLRGGAGMLLACLMSKGVSYLTSAELIERGYQDIVLNLSSLGVHIERIIDNEKI